MKEVEVEISRKARRHGDSMIERGEREGKLISSETCLIARRTTKANSCKERANGKRKAFRHHGSGAEGDGHQRSRERHVSARVEQGKESKGFIRLDLVDLDGHIELY